MDLAFLVLNLLILAITLESDLGVRRIRWLRILRPAVSAVIAVPFFFRASTSPPWGCSSKPERWSSGSAWATGRPADEFRHRSHRPAAPHPRRLVVRDRLERGVGAKILLTYAVTTWFPLDVGRFMAAHQLTPNSIRAAFIFLALGSPLARPAYLWIGGARYANAHGHTLRLFRPERQAAMS